LEATLSSLSGARLTQAIDFSLATSPRFTETEQRQPDHRLPRFSAPETHVSRRANEIQREELPHEEQHPG
jgi:hypothetical protein